MRRRLYRRIDSENTDLSNTPTTVYCRDKSDLRDRKLVLSALAESFDGTVIPTAQSTLRMALRRHACMTEIDEGGTGGRSAPVYAMEKVPLVCHLHLSGDVSSEKSGVCMHNLLFSDIG